VAAVLAPAQAAGAEAAPAQGVAAEVADGAAEAGDEEL
jgi:hypothetical protein